MYSNNLNGTYDYECERRNDERRAAAESRMLRNLDGERRLIPPAFMSIIGILAVFLVVFLAI